MYDQKEGKSHVLPHTDHHGEACKVNTLKPDETGKAFL